MISLAKIKIFFLNKNNNLKKNYYIKLFFFKFADLDVNASSALESSLFFSIKNLLFNLINN